MDCNNNLIDDECDIDCNAQGGACNVPGCGLSTDCNTNLIPDECEMIAEPAAADDCANALSICPGLTHSGTTVGANNDGQSSCASGVGIPDEAPDVWYSYTPASNGSATISLCGSSFDTVLALHSACPGTEGNEVACNDDRCGGQSQLTLDVTSGTTYLIRITGFGGEEGSYELFISGPDCQVGQLTNDCNGNSTLDECDIASLSSEDCDTNGLPDECERDTDNDGDIDACDLCPYPCADFDGDALVTLIDFSFFADCFAADLGLRPECNCADMDVDGVVGLIDFNVFATVFGTTPTQSPPFCDVPAPVCGNNIPEPGEECDDGNTDSGDGCSETCQFECVDADGDSYGDGTHGNVACAQLDIDCDDTEPAANPGETESTAEGNCADGIDNDCDGDTDAADSGCQ